MSSKEQNEPRDNQPGDDGIPPALYRELADTAPAFLALFNGNGERLVYLNAVAKQWTLANQETPKHALALHDMVGVEDLDSIKHTITPHLKVFGAWEGAIHLRDVWGSEYLVSARFSLWQSGKRDPEWLVLQARKTTGSIPSRQLGTVTDRELLHAILETLPESVYFKDLQCRFIRASRHLAKRVGKEDPAELIGLTDFDLYTAEHSRMAFEDERRIIATGDAIQGIDEKETYPDGHIAWVSTSKFPLKDNEGALVGTFGISRDITERKRIEQERHDLELQQQLSMKLESIGRLASGVAHEINTPTQFITDNMHFLKRAMDPMPRLLGAYRNLRRAIAEGTDPSATLAEVEHLERESGVDSLLSEVPQTFADTFEGLDRVTHIVRSLKDFSHPNMTEKSAVDVNRLVKTTVAVSRHEWKYVAEMKLELAHELPTVFGLTDEINQVLLNLVVNAAQAVEEANRKQRGGVGLGMITIRTFCDGTFVCIEVEDTGVGIPDAIKDRIFDPFFTTKDVGKGTGQGLAIVRTVIVRNHGGTIAFRSKPGEGTTFTVRLPQVQTKEATS